MGAEPTGTTSDASFELDEDTVHEISAHGQYRATVSGRWTVGGGPNGGYLAALILRAVLAASPLPDPLTMTVHYLARPMIGPCDIVVTTLREGRGHASYRAELLQDRAIRCASLVTVGRLRPRGASDFQPVAPKVPPPAECIAIATAVAATPLWERLEIRTAAEEDLFFLRREPGQAITGGWTRLCDGRSTDALAIALFLDCWPPAVFSRTMTADQVGAPTIEYTVHWRKAPSSQWCYARFETRTLAGGYVDESGELWDEKGLLLAESRQLARYLGGKGALS
ncbi:MAG: thioesterase family protein [Acidimicrobiales bacterium]